MKSLKYVAILFALFCIGNTYGQFSLQLSYVHPSGDFAYLMKPGGPEVELGFKIKTFHSDYIDSKYKLGGMVGYVAFHPTQDTFRTYSVGNPNGYLQLFPGYQVIHTFHQAFIAITNDYAFLAGKNSKFSPVLGLDFDLSFISESESYYAETVTNSSSSGNEYWVASFVPHLGAQYKITDNLLLSAGVGWSLRIAGDMSPEDYWKTYIAISYYKY